MEFSCNYTLQDLKVALFTYPQSPLSSVPSPQHLRIRRMTRGDTPDKLLAADSLTLKDLSISNDKNLAIQLLVESESGLSSAAMLLRVCTAIPKKAGTAVVTASDIEVGPSRFHLLAFDATPLAQLHHLLLSLSLCTAIHIDFLAALKWFPKDRTWKLLTTLPSNSLPQPSTQSNPLNPSKQANPSKQPKQPKQPKQQLIEPKVKDGNNKENNEIKKDNVKLKKDKQGKLCPLRQQPFCLQDNDIICAFDVRDFGLSMLSVVEIEKIMAPWINRPPPGMSSRDRIEERGTATTFAGTSKRKESNLKINFD